MIEHVLVPWAAATRPGRRLGHAVEAHRSIGSTNDRARELLDAGRPGVVVVAEEQTAGRGRRGRSWTSPAGANLTASVGLEVGLPAGEAWQLGLAVALALRDACSGAAGVSIGLKWPNDLVGSDAHKLGGLLVETAVDRTRLDGVVVGFGINVNWLRSAMPPEIADGATSLAELAGREVDRVALLRTALERLEAEVTAVEDGRSPLDRYRRACVILGRRVTVETPDGPREGTAERLDERGALVVRTAGGEVALTSGEVQRVRGSAR